MNIIMKIVSNFYILKYSGTDTGFLPGGGDFFRVAITLEGGNSIQLF